MVKENGEAESAVVDGCFPLNRERKKLLDIAGDHVPCVSRVTSALVVSFSFLTRSSTLEKSELTRETFLSTFVG